MEIPIKIFVNSLLEFRWAVINLPEHKFAFSGIDEFCNDLRVYKDFGQLFVEQAFCGVQGLYSW
jgi:hypothetical protein